VRCLSRSDPVLVWGRGDRGRWYGEDGLIGVSECHIEAFVIPRADGMAGFVAEGQERCVETIVVRAEPWEVSWSERDYRRAPDESSAEQETEGEAEGDEPRGQQQGIGDVHRGAPWQSVRDEGVRCVEEMQARSG